MATTAGTEGPEWSARAAGWAEQWGAFAAPAREALAEAAGIGPGTRVLDIGCGSGELCALAAGRGAEVAGIDAAEGMIEIARRRVPGADLRVGPMEQLPWEDGAFDVATAVNALQFAADYVGALAEAARVVRPGGVVAICNWGPLEHRDLFAVMACCATVRRPPGPDRRSRRARAACAGRRAGAARGGRRRRAVRGPRPDAAERAFLGTPSAAPWSGSARPRSAAGWRRRPRRSAGRRLLPVREPLPLSGGRGQPANAVSSFGRDLFLAAHHAGERQAPSVTRTPNARAMAARSRSDRVAAAAHDVRDHQRGEVEALRARAASSASSSSRCARPGRGRRSPPGRSDRLPAARVYSLTSRPTISSAGARRSDVVSNISRPNAVRRPRAPARDSRPRPGRARSWWGN